MFIVAYYKNDRLKFRLLGEFSTLEESLKFSSKHFRVTKVQIEKKLQSYGFWVNRNGYLIVDLESFLNGNKQKPKSTFENEFKLYSEIKSMSILWLRSQKLRLIF